MKSNKNSTRMSTWLLLGFGLAMGALARVGSAQTAASAPVPNRPMPTQTVPPETVPLWDSDPPGTLGKTDADIPTLTLFRPAPGKANGAAIVVCPGGGYGGLAPHEGKPVAEWLTTLGVVGVVLKYRVAPYHNPTMRQDVNRAIRVVRANAAHWGIDPHRIGVLGFSAGGHLASTAATHYDAGDSHATAAVERASSRPDLAILIYPVITMTDPFTHQGSRQNLLGKEPSVDDINGFSNERQVTADTPPAFLVHGADDTVVPVENSIFYAEACRKAHVPFEIHIYEHGPHGFGLGGNDAVLSGWPTTCAAWLNSRGFLKDH